MVKILIVKTSALGDIVHLYPAIQTLREVYPDCTIDWVVEKGGASLVAAHPLVHQALILDSKRWRKSLFRFAIWKEVSSFLKKLRNTRYDLVFDFQGNTKSGLLALFAKSPMKVGFGKKSVFERFNLLCTHFKHDPAPGLNARLEYISLVEAFSGQKAQTINLETEVQGTKVIQDLELESLSIGVEHSQKVKATPIENDYGSRDCVNLVPSTAVSRLKPTRLKISVEEKQKLEQLIQKKATTNIMVCPGSIWPNKQLTTSTLLAFLQSLKFEGRFWLIFGTQEEKQIALELQRELPQAELVEKLSLPLLQHWMGEMDQVIAMDSLPLHLAAEAGTPTFSIFGASSANKYRPLGTTHSSYQGICPYGRQFARRCPVLRSCPTGACIHDVKTEKLLDSFTKHYL